MSVRILDLFCGQGGAGMGYYRAGFEVFGVDLHPQPRYPFSFVQCDAIDYVLEHGGEFDAIHASPPCQRYSVMSRVPDNHPDLIDTVRTAIVRTTSAPYVIENVEGARDHLNNPVTLCGSMFGLDVRRHRLFESNREISAPRPCDHRHQGTPVGVYGKGPDRVEFLRPDGTRRGRKAVSTEHASNAMGGMPWANWHGIKESIPPAYTAFLGSQIIREVIE